MIWLLNFPMPPSVNEYLMPVAGGWAVSKNGKKFYQKGRFVKTPIHKKYRESVLRWADIHGEAFLDIKKELLEYIQKARLEKRRLALRVDAYFIFKESRIWTKNNLAERIDADNRLKPLRDALSEILEIDDKYFFSGFFEKIHTKNEDRECAIISIQKMTPRSKDQIMEIVRKKDT